MLESLFKEVEVLQGCNFIKNRLQHSCFPMNIFKNTYFKEHLRMAAASETSKWKFSVKLCSKIFELFPGKHMGRRLF